MKRIWIVLMTLILLLGVTACGQKAEVPAEESAPTWQEQYDLGLRYLSEGKYEEAILAFTAAIEIDGRQPQAYLGLADVYISQGDPEQAMTILKNALTATGQHVLITDKLTETENILSSRNSISETEKSEIMDAVDALLIGLMGSQLMQNRSVSDWTEDELVGVIYSKLIWDSYYSTSAYLHNIGLDWHPDDEGYFRFDLDLIEKITQDAFGRSFPTHIDLGYIFVEDDELVLSIAEGEMTDCVIQDVRQQGDRIIATGTGYHEDGLGSDYLGTFNATLRKNPDSLYGYTLESISDTQDEAFAPSLLASASSELKEGSVVHSGNNLLDGDLSTAWVEGVSGVGNQEWVQLQTSDGSKLTLTAIQFALGYQKSEQTLSRNGWPTKVLIECEDGYFREAAFYEYTDAVIFERPVTTSWVRVTILDAAAGSHFEDTCISEIYLYGLSPDTAV